jgi:hypothetical protein
MDRKTEFERELMSLLNRFSIDNDCNTPDYILMKYITDCIDAYKECNERTLRHKL